MKLKRILIFLLIINILALFALYYPSIKSNITSLTGSSISYYNKEQAIMLRAVDGDTIHALVNGKDETIRLLGINTPEKNMPFYQEAKDFLKQYENRTIILERENEDKDKYNRYLRYIFYDNKNLNIELIEQGLANTYLLQNSKYEQELLKAEQQARNNEIGIWKSSKEECSVNDCIILINLNDQEEYFTIKNTCNFNCNLEGWFVKDSGRNTFYLSSLNKGEEKTYFSEKDSNLKRAVWDEHDQLFMYDKQGFLVLYYEY
jgi:micrococcal nuclease